ncbi:MAG: hypothetical protein RDV48_23570 [Candidatus Eremiobacteraeota bacterium]|nr:hypothetical protein [Candidatus Eremiobacteraeota bacterium]
MSMERIGAIGGRPGGDALQGLGTENNARLERSYNEGSLAELLDSIIDEGDDETLDAFMECLEPQQEEAGDSEGEGDTWQFYNYLDTET